MNKTLIDPRLIPFLDTEAPFVPYTSDAAYADHYVGKITAHYFYGFNLFYVDGLYGVVIFGRFSALSVPMFVEINEKKAQENR